MEGGERSIRVKTGGCREDFHQLLSIPAMLKLNFLNFYFSIKVDIQYYFIVISGEWHSG